MSLSHLHMLIRVSLLFCFFLEHLLKGESYVTDPTCLFPIRQSGST